MDVDEALAIVDRAARRDDNPGQVLAAEVRRLRDDVDDLCDELDRRGP